MSKDQLSRRNFLEKSALIGVAGVIGLNALSSCKNATKEVDYEFPPLLDQAPDGKKLKVGLVGCGNRGTGAALNFLAAGHDLHLVALADVFEDKVWDCRDKLLKQRVEVPETNCFWGFDAYKSLLDVDLDVVILATPPHFRPMHFDAAVQAKKHVFLEKPVCVDPVGARQIMATSKKAESMGLSVITGTQRRYSRDYLETYRQVASGAIGDLVSAKAYWLQSHVWFRTREEGWSDMEYMLRNWNSFCWLGGDHILDTHVHNIDIVNWFMGKTPESAIGFGGRHRRLTGDQYDFFSIDFDFGNGISSHSFSRQIDGCANQLGEVIMGTEGYTNCKNTVFNHDGSVKWTYEYPKNKDGRSTGVVAVSPYVQEHIHLVTSIRTNKPVVEAYRTAESTLTAVMGRTAAYTGQKVTWEDMMSSNEKLGPKKYEMGPVDMEFPVPLQGTQHKA
ncbi:Tat (twin-arginine translocation) pathway signal sequence [Draconibacterium orientale]|uniref:Oxidoreductase n=1 Tax=Draconibacterium orientale TaxID=1168034 RepID=X5DGR5_9BACT|nr:Gfo/Idh/MocA family oxidoreductase [Draconibacterium orientale]AHW59647.1 oxidoreductase [Draconibacterium orientale]SES81003.1 Tat (twin-arginine translocation) pathway signal sequence [Draconibacterium orientale]